MKILVIGSGGREHTLLWKIKQSPLVKDLYAAPGNGGISKIAKCVSINVEDFNSLVNFAKEEKIDLTVVGPEIPLVKGIVDLFDKEGLCIFGPNKASARLEGSKVFSKSIMTKYNIPTSPHMVFEKSIDAKNYLIDSEPPFVIKADGLAAGKGVIIAKNSSEAVQAVTNIIENKIFGDAGNKIIIEDFIDGEELSVLAFTDGNTIIPLASSQDHKRAFDNDEGPNTGGMGAYSPCPLVSQDDLKYIVDKTIKPAILGLKNEGITYKGLIYAGLIISKKGPLVLEFNVRFGDPETQAVLPRLKDDIVPLFLETAKGKLKQRELSWDHRSCINVVMASGGYPGQYKKGYEIYGLDKDLNNDEVFIFHAGTVYNDKGQFYTNGGRVLSVSALGDSIKDAKNKAYKELDKIKFQEGFYRKDIGLKAIQHIVR